MPMSRSTRVLAPVALVLLIIAGLALARCEWEPRTAASEARLAAAGAPRELTPEPVTTTTSPPASTTTTQPAPPPTTAARHASRHAASRPAATVSGRCGGDLPPCWVMNRESGGNLNAYNPTGCGGRGCYGKWQCDPRTCSGHGTEAQQDAEAAALWDHGRGCSHWAAC